MKTIVVTNQKGGVGKSTVAIHIAYRALERGLKVAFLDMDTQGNSSNSLIQLDFENKFTFQSSELFSSDFAVKKGDLCIGIGDQSLSDVLPNAFNDVYAENLDVLSNHFDICIIDTAPTANFLQTLPLCLADFVLSPIELGKYSIDGISAMLETIDNVKEHFNPNLKFLGMLPNKVKTGSKAHSLILNALYESYGELMFEKFYIKDRQVFAESVEQSLPIWHFKRTAARDVQKELKELTDLIISQMGA